MRFMKLGAWLLLLLACERRTLQGGGVLSVDPEFVDFGSVTANARVTATIKLSNLGAAKVQISNTIVEGQNFDQFKLEEAPPPQLLPGETVTVTVAYSSPSATGAISRAALVFESDAANQNRLPVLLSAQVDGVCVASTCATLSACGVVGDGCGHELRCAPCGLPVDAGAPDAGDDCVRRNCASRGAECGTIDDGCGATLSCGTCTSPNICGGAGVANQCGTGDIVPEPPLAPLVSQCLSKVPAFGDLPCLIAETGQRYYVSPSGSDTGDGRSPATAWRSLARAIANTPAGNTVVVAQGIYLDATLTVNKGISIKGGFDQTFTNWSPTTYPSVIGGRLVLDHALAVVGGFRIINQSVTLLANEVRAGTLIRNSIEVKRFGSAVVTTVEAIFVNVAGSATVKLSCNDIHLGTPLLTTNAFAVRVASIDGKVHLDKNRICGDASSMNGLDHGALSARIGCGSSLHLTNNIIEGRGAHAVSIVGCSDALLLTNNTILSRGNGVYSSRADVGALTWRFVNNLTVNLGGGNASGSPFDFATGSGASVRIAAAQGNMTAGWSSGQFNPAPVMQMGNIAPSAVNLSMLFVDPAAGDLRPKSSSQAADGGVNVYGNTQLGAVTDDLLGRPRPPTGGWSRGALTP